jgi:hypothetical protein
MMPLFPPWCKLPAGNVFGLSAAAEHIYLAPSGREGNIWLAAPKPSK